MLMDPEFAENIFSLEFLCWICLPWLCVFFFFKLYKMTFIKVISSDLNWNIFCLSVLSLKKSPCLQTFKVFYVLYISNTNVYTVPHTKGDKDSVPLLIHTVRPESIHSTPLVPHFIV